jgi:lipopolysaccharide export system protein LptC
VLSQVRAAGDRYSRWVALLKVILPVIGVTLLCLVSIWPRLPALWETMQGEFPAIDLREARELRMINPRYAGLDRYNRPFLVTAAVGRQVPDRNDVMSLEQPRGVMTLHSGASVVVTAATGIYQSEAQLLDLFQDVNLVHHDTTRFETQRAHLNLSNSTAEGHQPVEGHGPSGDITGEGFLVLAKGNTIIFTGQSSLVLRGAKPAAATTQPAMLPAEVEKSAMQIEASAASLPIAAPMPASPVGALGKPKQSKPADRSVATTKPQPLRRHLATTSAGSTLSSRKPNHHGG